MLSFVKNADFIDMLNETLLDLLSKLVKIITLTFLCNVHQTDMLTDIRSKFIIMIMRQYKHRLKIK